ncbi:MAG TPA: hypothetical protein VM734_21300 [Kofleriaceae bacterium]|nr:hypothetical protein [Kofleriaceae bacterium]
MRRSVATAGLVAAIAACAPSRAAEPPPGRADAPAPGPAPAPRPGPAPAPGPDGRRWIAGDLHVHIAPFDAREGASLRIADLERDGPAAGLEFVIVTPHVHPRTLASPGRRREWMTRWSAMAAEARAARALTIIPGTEYTVWGYGHFGVSGLDLAAVRGDDVFGAAAAAAALVVVNHPYAVPTGIPGIPISERDLSFRPWTAGAAAGPVPRLDGVEVWNLPLGLANLASRPGGQSGEQRAFATADALARREGRPIATVGGSDTHARHLVPTTWVLAADAGEAAILAAVRAGATCVGSPAAGTLVARGDAEPVADRWARIGESTRARARVDLRWTGRARLFVDGVDRGEHDGAWTHTATAGAHTYRIEQDGSRCGFVYANVGP